MPTARRVGDQEGLHLPELRVAAILKDGHEDLRPDALLYMKSMSERHGFTVLDEIEEDEGGGRVARIEIDYPFLKDRVFLALLEEG